MKPFRFCPACASELDDSDSEGGAGCPSCGRSWYQNSDPTAAAAIVRAAEVLVTVRARPPMQGRVDLPGGFLRLGEPPLDGLRREVKEELGVEIDVRDEDYLQAVAHTYGDEEDWVLSLGFGARLTSGEIMPADDVAEARWVTYGEIDDLDWAWPHDRDLAHAALRRLSDGSSR